jgi:hypothetical protein
VKDTKHSSCGELGHDSATRQAQSISTSFLLESVL